MIKLLIRATLVVIFSLTALTGWQLEPVRTVKAVEIQPGGAYPAENPGSESNFLVNSVDGQQYPNSIVAGSDWPVASDLPSLAGFIDQVRDGQAGGVRGLYVPGQFALRIVQQPDGQVDFISYLEDTATQYQSPALQGVIGLLAHNFLAGRFFFQILPGQRLTLVYGDGRTEAFQVADIHDYQRLTELDLHSDFLDLQTQETISANALYQLYYQGEQHLTLQTCLEKDGNNNWGVRMITALPIAGRP